MKHLTEKTPLLNRLIDKGLVWAFGDRFVGRTTDGVKFGLGSVDRPADAEKFLRLYWDADLIGVSVIAPNLWHVDRIPV